MNLKQAMAELETLNARPGVASNSMVLFLAINTSSVTLLPTGVIADVYSRRASVITGVFLSGLAVFLCRIVAECLYCLPCFAYVVVLGNQFCQAI